MNKVKITIEGLRPGIELNMKSGIAFKFENESKRDFIYNLRQALIALYAHELDRVNAFHSSQARDTEAHIFNMELKLEEE